MIKTTTDSFDTIMITIVPDPTQLVGNALLCVTIACIEETGGSLRRVKQTVSHKIRSHRKVGPHRVIYNVIS